MIMYIQHPAQFQEFSKMGAMIMIILYVIIIITIILVLIYYSIASYDYDTILAEII